MNGKSLNIAKEKLSKLKEIIPEAFSENEIDWEKLKAALGGDIEFKNERYVLNWAGKSDAFRALQAPSSDTLAPCKEESINFDTTENIFIEGENLEVLKVLQKAYFGKIKMIYIDPPYNTGNDHFIYPDRFSESKEEYLSRIGDKDETGLMTREGLFRKNSKDSGHYHSNWLSMMYPRLFLARNLLREDGVIFVSIDDNEVHNLRLLMNEVFGEENFVAQFVWRTDGNFDNQAKIKNCHEYVLLYAKSEDMFLHPPVVDPNVSDKSKLYKDEIRNTIVKNGPKNPESKITLPKGFPVDFDEGKFEKRSNTWPKYLSEGIVKNGKLNNDVIVSSGWSSRDLLEEFILNNLRPIKDNKGQETTFLISTTGAIEVIKKRNDNQSHVLSVLTNMGGSQKASSELEGLNIIFDNYPKPTIILKYLMKMANNSDYICLDFFAGSGTTAHAALELNKEDGGNRKFICVQLPEKLAEDSKAFKAGYKNIAEIGKERIRRVIKKISDDQSGKLDLDGHAASQDLGFKVFKLRESNFKIWRTNIETEEELVMQMQQHLEPLDEHARQEDVLYELLIKSGVLLTAKIKEKQGYILANDNEVALMLERANDKIIKQIIAAKPQKVFTLDRLFKNNDKLKTNTALQMKDAGIEFKVI